MTTNIPEVKLKAFTAFPSKVQATSPVLLDKTGGVYTISLDEDQLREDIGAPSIADVQAAQAAAAASAATASAEAAAAAASASALGNQVQQFDTRAQAIAATIPAGVNFVRTLAYDSSFTPSSGALFARVAAGTPFLDSYPLSGTISAGSGYVDGTYRGVPLGGSVTGNGLVATVTVSGGAVTAVSHNTQPGNAYKVGDILTIANSYLGGSGSGFTYTIASVSTPTASFTNGSGSLWQYLPEKETHVNQFGAKPDWNGTDAGATNNFTAIQNALFFGARHGGTNSDAGGYAGDVVRCSVGSYMLASSPAASLIVPFGVFLEGVGGSTLKFSDGFDPGTHCVTLGDPNSHLACFRSGLRKLTLFFQRDIAVSANTFMVYSNSTQDNGGLDDVYLYCGNRGGLYYEAGYGGASTVRFHNISMSFAGTNPGALFDVGTTLVDCRNWSCNAPSSGINNTIDTVVLKNNTWLSGMYSFEGFHTEGIPNGFNVSLAAPAQVAIKNATGGNGCTQIVTLQSTNSPGNLSLQNVLKNGATRVVTNGQPAGSNRTADVLPKDGLVFFNP